jgi:hypothetical protein
MQSVRRRYFTDGRTMSYKRLSDYSRQDALVPFLNAAADLDGHLVAIAVDKRKKWLSTIKGLSNELRKAFQLSSSWNERALEDFFRKVQFTAILLSFWSRPYGNVNWITDQDEFVANDSRHDDALQAVARMSSFYITHPMGILRLNTTGQESETREYEDICAIPDLVAGMLSEISTRLTQVKDWGDRMQKVIEDQLPVKTEVIADWFWDAQMRLRKTLVTIDVESTGFAVRKVSMQQG